MDCFFLCGRRISQRILLVEKWLLTPERATFIRCCAALLSVVPASRVMSQWAPGSWDWDWRPDNSRTLQKIAFSREESLPLCLSPHPSVTRGFHLFVGWVLHF